MKRRRRKMMMSTAASGRDTVTTPKVCTTSEDESTDGKKVARSKRAVAKAEASGTELGLGLGLGVGTKSQQPNGEQKSQMESRQKPQQCIVAELLSKGLWRAMNVARAVAATVAHTLRFDNGAVVMINAPLACISVWRAIDDTSRVAGSDCMVALIEDGMAAARLVSVTDFCHLPSSQLPPMSDAQHHQLTGVRDEDEDEDAGHASYMQELVTRKVLHGMPLFGMKRGLMIGSTSVCVGPSDDGKAGYWHSSAPLLSGALKALSVASGRSGYVLTGCIDALLWDVYEECFVIVDYQQIDALHGMPVSFVALKRNMIIKLHAYALILEKLAENEIRVGYFLIIAHVAQNNQVYVWRVGKMSYSYILCSDATGCDFYANYVLPDASPALAAINVGQRVSASSEAFAAMPRADVLARVNTSVAVPPRHHLIHPHLLKYLKQ